MEGQLEYDPTELEEVEGRMGLGPENSDDELPFFIPLYNLDIIIISKAVNQKNTHKGV